MKTAAPCTRTIYLLCAISISSDSVTLLAYTTAKTASRPVFHVCITASTTTAIATGNHPPSTIFNAFDEKKAKSMTKNKAQIVPILYIGQFQFLLATKK